MSALRAALLLVTCLFVTSAQAQDCQASAAPQVALSLEASEQLSSLLPRVQGQLAASLASRGIGLCMWREQLRTPLAHVHIALEGDESAGVQARIQIGDAVTDKRVERTSELRDVPADMRALAIATSADELLRASWAELVLIDAPPPVRPPPPVVTRAVAASLATSARVNELSVEGLASVARLRSAFGMRARFTRWFGERWGATLAAASSFGLRRNAPHGSVRADTLALELAGNFALVPISRSLGATLELGVSVGRAAFSARANTLGEADSFADWYVTAHGRVRGFAGRGPIRATLALGASQALRAAKAYDQGKTVTSTSGTALEVLAGVIAFF